MRIVLACVLASAVTGAWTATAPAVTTPGPRIVLAATGPGQVVISGARFRASERVTLRLVAVGRTTVKVVRASVAGRIATRFERGVPNCEAFTLSAVGNLGSRVFYRELPPPCGIVIQP